MKKICIFALGLVVALSLCACACSNDTLSTEPTDTRATTPTSSTTAPTAGTMMPTTTMTIPVPETNIPDPNINTEAPTEMIPDSSAPGTEATNGSRSGMLQ